MKGLCTTSASILKKEFMDIYTGGKNNFLDGRYSRISVDWQELDLVELHVYNMFSFERGMPVIIELAKRTDKRGMERYARVYEQGHPGSYSPFRSLEVLSLCGDNKKS